MTWPRRELSAASLLVLCACAPQGAQGITFDATGLAGARASLDPRGGLRLTGEGRGWQVHFRALEWPAAQVWKIGPEVTPDSLPVSLVQADGGLSALAQGSVRLDACGPKRVRGEIDYVDGKDPMRHRVAFDLEPELRPLDTPRIDGAKPIGAFPEPARTPEPADLVFCALGNQGSGLPGQKRVADALARLAPSGPLDFVLLLGANFPPHGVTLASDPLWQERFDAVYDPKALAVPFYPVLGAEDWHDKNHVVKEYGRMNRRWTMKDYSYDFVVESHGKKLHFFAADTTRLTGKIEDARTRITQRLVIHPLEQSRADWKIVFGHHALYSTRKDADQARLERMRLMLELWFQKFGVDLYICADDRVLQLLQPAKGVRQVTSGGGAGPELAGSTVWSEETTFAATGGGFTWFRFDGKKLEITFCDSDGKPLFVHHLTK